MSVGAAFLNGTPTDRAGHLGSSPCPVLELDWIAATIEKQAEGASLAEAGGGDDSSGIIPLTQG